MKPRSAIAALRPEVREGSAAQSKPRTVERELERARASRDELAERIARHLPKDGTLEAAPGLFIAKAIELFRKNAEKPLRVAGFARQIGLFPEIDLRL